MREAAVMLIINNEGKILGVSRKNDPTKFGLAGGKLEPDEMPHHAAFRETLEETTINVKMCAEFFKREEPTLSGEVFYTYCFYAINWEGSPIDSEEGVVKWLTTEELTVTHGAFPDYNKAMLAAFKLKYPNILVK